MSSPIYYTNSVIKNFFLHLLKFSTIFASNCKTKVLDQIRLQRFLTALAILIFVSGCNITRNVKKDEYLLHKNKIEINKKECGIKDIDFTTDDLYGLIQQQPNKTFLGFIRFRLWVNSYASAGKQTKFKKWMGRKMGHEPVILDPFQIDRSVDQMELYINNNGFFNSVISTEIINKKKKATVKYNITLAKPYRINHVEYKTDDTAVRNLIYADTINSLFRPGSIYNASLLDDERYRISAMLRNLGYYYFSPEFVFYEVDSAFQNKTLTIFQNIEQVLIPNDTNSSYFDRKNHQKYFLNRITINPDFNPVHTDTGNMSVIVDTNFKASVGDYSIYYRDKLKIRQKTLINSIFLEPSKIYTEIAEKNTYKQLSGFALFGYTSLAFKPATHIFDPQDSTKKFLNCAIELTRRPVQSFSIETEGTTSGGKLGVAGNVVYRNLNIFRGGEVFTFKLTGGVEWQAGGINSEPVLLFFNTVQTGAEATLNIPKFLLPFSQDRIPKTLQPRTTFKTGVNYQNRPDYERYVTNVSFGYNWRARTFESHSLIPIDISSVSIFPDSSFVKRLEELNDQRLINQYTDHFIMSAKYSYIFNNQQRNKIQNFTFFRWDIETSGNVLNLANNLTNSPKNENDEFTVWNIPFAQYARTNIDFRYYFALKDEHTLVYRNLFGIGIPYGNSKVLPFEKGFYTGGSNDMRGWSYRTLGPGSFSDTIGNSFEKMGDVIIQASVEYRFPIYSWFKGAIFTDIGNVWLLNLSESYPGGQFEFKNFMGELAIDAGVGLRMDFSFFIFRIDGAAPIKNPVFSSGNRWRISTLQLKDVIWNFGIGYPF